MLPCAPLNREEPSQASPDGDESPRQGAPRDRRRRGRSHQVPATAAEAADGRMLLRRMTSRWSDRDRRTSTFGANRYVPPRSDTRLLADDRSDSQRLALHPAAAGWDAARYRREIPEC